MVFAVREPNGDRELTGLPELMVDALDDTDARALLAAAMPGAIDERVRERILAEARGNPLALFNYTLVRHRPNMPAATDSPNPGPLPVASKEASPSNCGDSRASPATAADRGC